MMKRPNPTFLKKAEGIKTARKRRTLIIILVLLVLTLGVVFVSTIASSQDTYRLKYPGLVGAATSTTTAYSEYSRPVHTTETTEATTTETTAQESESPHAVIAVTPTPVPEETTSDGTQDNSPDSFIQVDHFSFQPQGIRTATYQDRAVYLDALKDKISKYQANNAPSGKAVRNDDEVQSSGSGMRICFDFIELSTGEHLGIDELDPVVPSAAMAIPISIVYYDQIATTSGALSQTITYNSDTVLNPEYNKFTDRKNLKNYSYIYSTFSSGKEFYIRNILNYAVAKGDIVALNYLISNMGGLDPTIESIDEISGYISYNDSILYKDFRGVEHLAPGTTSCYDMGNYLSYMYRVFINNPQVNQRLIDDLAASEVASPLSAAFPENTSILHVYGFNNENHTYMECAIVDYKEPIALVIYVEAGSEEKAQEAIATLGGYAKDYIDSCYK